MHETTFERLLKYESSKKPFFFSGVKVSGPNGRPDMGPKGHFVHIFNPVFSCFAAQILLDSLCAKDDCVREAVLACELAANEGRFRLRDLLAVPMQRVLKYHLLLKELLNHTREFHILHRRKKDS